MSKNTEQEAASSPTPETPVEAQTAPLPTVESAALEPVVATPQHHVSTGAKIAIAASAGVLAGMLLIGAAFAVPAALHGFAARRAYVNQGQMMGRGFDDQGGGAYGRGGTTDDGDAYGRGGMMGGRGSRGQGGANADQACPGCSGSGTTGGYGPGSRGNMPCDPDGDGQPDVAPQGNPIPAP